ncbi:hypothetical protein Taro_016657 [Colocasia esculenta]|uniref:VPS37 C-terminal domain-containing protein n=1 Tax=Colocasia esculenta TaxID=4460 RepID=A0A843UWX9_COLES|nr:hypothetical protein [Colocasia esculenta]
MNWKFPTSFLGSGVWQYAPLPSLLTVYHVHRSGQEQNQAQDIPTQSWYPPSVVDLSTSSSRPSVSSGSSSISAHQRPSDNLQSPSSGQPSPAEAAGTIARLKDKRMMVRTPELVFGSTRHTLIVGGDTQIRHRHPFGLRIDVHYVDCSVDELRKLLTDKDAYNSFFHSLEQVKVQNNLRDELEKETLQLARENLDKEPQILELRNQCQIIRATEVAAALEKLSELEKQKEETLKFYSPHMLLQKLQDANDKVEEESDMLHRQLLENQIDLSAFVQRYKKLRAIYHRRALIHLAAKTSAI